MLTETKKVELIAEYHRICAKLEEACTDGYERTLLRRRMEIVNTLYENGVSSQELVGGNV